MCYFSFLLIRIKTFELMKTTSITVAFVCVSFSFFLSFIFFLHFHLLCSFVRWANVFVFFSLHPVSICCDSQPHTNIRTFSTDIEWLFCFVSMFFFFFFYFFCCCCCLVALQAVLEPNRSRTDARPSISADMLYFHIVNCFQAYFAVVGCRRINMR